MPRQHSSAVARALCVYLLVVNHNCRAVLLLLLIVIVALRAVVAVVKARWRANWYVLVGAHATGAIVAILDEVLRLLQKEIVRMAL